MEFDATFLIAVISFVVFVFIMNKIFYAPILRIMSERQKLVADNFNSARITSEETNKQAQYYDDELEKSRDEARQKVAQKSQELKQERSKIISEFKKELFNNISEEKENLRNSAIDAKEVLKDSVVDIAKEISAKLLGADVNSDVINKSQIKEEQA